MPVNDSVSKCPMESVADSQGRKPRGRMYGILFESIQFFVNNDYGKEAWEAVLEHAGLSHAIFSAKKTFPDSWMVQLAKSTHHVLQVPSVNDVMFYFGTCFVNFCTKVSYDKVLRNAGRTYRDFLNEIDNIHENIRFSHPKMQSPSFVVQSEDRNGCVLVYRSMRTGFTYYVMGQLWQCAKQFYQVHVKIIVLEELISEHGCNVTFRLNFNNHAYATISTTDENTAHLSSYPKVKSETFFKLFPFCLVFNSNLSIMACGGRLAGLLHSHNTKPLGTPVNDVFNLRRPLVDFTWNNVMCHQRVVFEMAFRKANKTTHNSTENNQSVGGEGGGGGNKNNDGPSSNSRVGGVEREKNGMGTKKLLLRGQMKYVKDWDAIAFLCTPILSNLDEMQRAGMYLQDLSVFDNSRDLVWKGQECASDIEYNMERQMAWTNQIEATLTKLSEVRQKSEDLINSMLTKSIADRLKRGVDALDTCEVVKCVQNATEVFDKIVDKHQLFKVETLGDGVYMVAGGVPDRCEDHAQRVAGLALELLENAQHVKHPITDKGMRVLIGMHTGSVVAGIVGKRTPQYCLFGDTVNTAARMQTNSLPGRIHLTQPCHECLQRTQYATVYRGRLPIKGKGEMKTYWLVGRKGEPSTKEMCHLLLEEHYDNIKNRGIPSTEPRPITNTRVYPSMSSLDTATENTEDDKRFEASIRDILSQDDEKLQPPEEDGDEDVKLSLV